MLLTGYIRIFLRDKTNPWPRRVLAVICTSAVLIFLGMTAHPLWGDEAETALFAKNILATGLPSGWDGTNIMGLNDGIVLDKNLLNHRSPWAQYYLAALSFKLFGISTFSARLLFAVLSLASLLLLYLLTQELTQNNRLAFITVVLCGLSVPFIMYAYQSRYNSLTVFASLLLTWSLYRLATHKRHVLLPIILSATLFFYSHYLSFAAFMISVCLASLVFKPRLRKFIPQLIRAGIVVALLTVPWLLWMKPASGGSNYGFPNFHPVNALELFRRYLYDFNENGGLPVILVPFFFRFLRNDWKKPLGKSVLFVVLTCLGYLLVFSFLSIQNLRISVRSDIRYAMNIFPLLMILPAYTVTNLFKLRRNLGIIIMLLLLLTNLLSLKWKPNLWLADYLEEVTDKSYITSPQAVVAYLQSRISAGDTAFVTPDYYVEPLQFYLGDKIRFINRISPASAILENNRNRLPAYVYKAPDPPKWIILFGKSPYQFDWRVLPANVDTTRYQGVQLPVVAYDLTRPEIFLHAFKPVRNFGELNGLYVYELR